MSGSAAPPNLTVSSNGIGVVADSLLNTFVQGAAVVANVRAFVGLSNMTIVTVGQTTPGDGGGRTYYWAPTATAADDGLNVIQPNGVSVGRWLSTGTSGTVPANQVLMVQPQGGSSTSTWVVYTPDGTILNTTGSTTSGLQEALNYAAATGYSCNVLVLGGDGVGVNPGTQYGEIFCSTTVIFPPLRSIAVRMYGVHIIFTSGVTGNGIVFDSMDNALIDIIGEVVYQGNASAIVFDPRTPVPVDGGTFLSGSYIRIAAVATNGGAPIACVEMDTNTSAITGNKFDFGELNGAGGQLQPAVALYGIVVVDPESNTSFEQNIIDIGIIHLVTNAGIQIGTTSTNQGNNRQNVWRIGGILPDGASSVGFDSFGSSDVVQIGGITNEQGTLNIGVVFQSGANNNAITLGACSGHTGTILQDGGVGNYIIGANARGTNSYGATKGVVYNPDGTIYQYINNASSSTGGAATSWAVPFPTEVLTVAAVASGSAIAVGVASTTSAVTITSASATPPCNVYALGR